MDAIQAVAAATQIVSGMISAVGAFEKASRDLDEAPNRIHSLEEFVRELERLTQRVKQKHVHKLHNSKLDRQITSLNALIHRLHPKLTKARSVLPKNKVKSYAKAMWNSMAGDPLGKIVTSMKDDLNSWLESQRLAQDVEEAIESTANSVATQLKIKIEQGYPVSSKCGYVRDLLERNDTHRVILIVGLSGIGKSCLVRQVASNPPGRFSDGAVELGFGQWCSRAACNGNKDEYQKRLARKFSKLLVLIGFRKMIKDDRSSGDLEQICLLLQEALLGKRLLIVLDDVWEQDIVERFAKLYDNDCKYVVTTRNEAVYEITEAEKVELNKDDIKEISKAVLLYHCLLSEKELPV